jgi:homoserine kinase
MSLNFLASDKNPLPIMQAVTVRVPASTSNLGPGFDCLGVALRLYNRVTVMPNAGNNIPVLDEAGRHFFRRAVIRPFRFSCFIDEKVPRSRGLGSSATIRAGLLHSLNQLAGSPLDRLALFRLCAELEGHPDNAAPACFGGFTIARAANIQRFDVSSRLHFVLLIPDQVISTSVARRILPKRIERTDAVESCANACAIVAAFVSGNYRALEGIFADRLHQPFRKKLMPFLPRVIAAAEKAGALGAFLSGSGSTIAAITLESPKKVAAAMARAAGSTKARTLIVSADNEGVQVLPIRNPRSKIRDS